MDTTSRLMRSRTDTMIAGVAAGIARYLSTDPAIVRLLFVLLTFSGPGLFIYLLLWLVMPREPAAGDPQAPSQVFVSTGATQRLRVDPSMGGPGEPEQEIPINNVGARTGGSAAGPTGGNRVLGYLLLGLGAFITLQMIWPGFAVYLFPAALISAGVWLLRRP